MTPFVVSRLKISTESFKKVDLEYCPTKHNQCDVDCFNQKMNSLVDSIVIISVLFDSARVSAIQCHANLPSLLVCHGDGHTRLHSRWVPSLVCQSSDSLRVKTKIQQHFETNDTLVFAHPRTLPPDKHQTSNVMLELKLRITWSSNCSLAPSI